MGFELRAFKTLGLILSSSAESIHCCPPKKRAPTDRHACAARASLGAPQLGEIDGSSKCDLRLCSAVQGASLPLMSLKQCQDGIIG